MDQWITVFEWVGAACGILGAVMMASKSRWSRWAYPVWLVSSTSFMVFGVLGGYHALLTTQVIFTGINIYGTYQWVVKGWVDSLYESPRYHAHGKAKT